MYIKNFYRIDIDKILTIEEKEFMNEINSIIRHDIDNNNSDQYRLKELIKLLKSNNIIYNEFHSKWHDDMDYDNNIMLSFDGKIQVVYQFTPWETLSQVYYRLY